MKHALVVGGTGMLRKVCLWLEKQDYRVTVVGRSTEKMGQLLKEASNPTQFTPLFVDYRNIGELRKQVAETIEKNGPIELVVAWIHSHAKETLSTIYEVVNESCGKWELFHVLGSSANLAEIKREIPIKEDCSYQQIQLGFVIEKECSRWLTHDEISDGVVKSIQEKVPKLTIGQIGPWEKRP